MNNETVYFKDFDELLLSLNSTFRECDPSELRDLWIHLQSFQKEYVLPDDILIYVTKLPVDGLEVRSGDSISETLVEGTKKYIQLKYTSKSIPPAIIVKGNVRLMIMYGESYAIEAFVQKVPLKAIVFDTEDKDPFEIFNLDPNQAVFLTPILQKFPSTNKS